MTFSNKLYLTSFNGNVDMRCRTVIEPSIRRSGSTVVGVEKDDTNCQSLNELYEVTQSQRITKKSLGSFESLNKET